LTLVRVMNIEDRPTERMWKNLKHPLRI